MFESITIEPESEIAPTPESQAIAWMHDFMQEHHLSHFSIQLDKPEGKRKGRPGFYCNQRGQSGQSSKGAESALANLKAGRVVE